MDHHGHEHDREHDVDEPILDPADDERVRQLLGEARHTEPIPADVAARLDGVLADLHADRAEKRAPVVDLAARRRRTAASLLVAAAAVVVVGVGVGQVLPDLGGSTADSPTAADAQQEAGGSEAEAPADTNRNQPNALESASAGAKSGGFRIRSDHFGADVRAIRTTALADSSSAYLEHPVPCLGGGTGGGTPIAATYDGAAAVLLLRPVAGDTQVVDLYLCGQDEPLRSITLASP